jgi:hypothetical protein
LEEILTRGHAPSPVLQMPQQYPLQQPPSQQQQQQPYMTEPYMPNDNNTSNMYGSPRQQMYNNYPQYPAYSPTQRQTQLPPPPPPPNNSSNMNPSEFQRFYGPVSLHTKKLLRRKIFSFYY